jgi:Putative peptidoglycan binding domain
VGIGRRDARAPRAFPRPLPSFPPIPHRGTHAQLLARACPRTVRRDDVGDNGSQFINSLHDQPSRRIPKFYAIGETWRGPRPGNALVMNKGSRRALLLAASAAVMAYLGLSREPPSSPAQHIGDAERGTGVVGAHIAARTESMRRPPGPEASLPEAMTVVVLPRSTQRGMIVLPARSFAGDPVGLVRELQRELRRVGCYSQEIDGEWSPATQRAMKDFTDRVNAFLSLKAPDPVFLALLQSERKAVCGSTCPAGQDLTKDNRCLPTALLALSPPQLAALLERTNAKRSVGETDASTVPPATTAAAVPSAYRTHRRSNNSGSWFFGLFGW